MTIDHPYIDFDGDGQADAYQTLVLDHQHTEFVHLDCHGRIDAIAYDDNRDGRIDVLTVDDDHDGHMDRQLVDDNGDGYMDRSTDLPHGSLRHPSVDFDGNGTADPYLTTSDGSEQLYLHLDGYGHVDHQAVDATGDGLIDRMLVDDDHDGRADRLLIDTNGDGIMDRSYPRG